MMTITNNHIAQAIYLISKNKTNIELNDLNKKIIKFFINRQLLSRSSDILNKLNNIINKENKQIEIKVSSKEKLTENLKAELTILLKERYKAKDVFFLEKIDEKLLGGIKLEIEDEVIDLTIKNKVKKLQEYLTRKT